MQIQQLYAKYQIMPQLATHMLRVAGIAKIITDSWTDHQLADTCVKVCLLHDMGNLAKFDLTTAITEIDNLPLWQERQKTFWQKYGHEAHAATYAILRELNLREYISYLEAEAKIYVQDPTIDDFRMAPLPALLVLYADLRVSIQGVVSMDERIADLTARYGEARAEARWGKLLETYIQSLTKVSVDQISEQDVEPFFRELLTYSI